MSVNAVNFKSSMGCSPLRNDNHVSFARKQYSEETKTENKKSHTGAYIATGIGLAAAIAAGLVFKKQVGSFFKNLKMPSFDKVKEKVVQGAEKVKDAVNNAKVKEKVSNTASSLKSKVVKFAKFAWSKIVAGAKFVKNLAVSLWNKVSGFFTSKAPKA